jgi:hypothetical protein
LNAVSIRVTPQNGEKTIRSKRPPLLGARDGMPLATNDHNKNRFRMSNPSWALRLTGQTLSVSAHPVGAGAGFIRTGGTRMGSIDEQILKTAKEVAIKFIECGRLSPSGFAETFQGIYKAVDDTVKAHTKAPVKPPEAKGPGTGPKASSSKR